MLLQRDKETNFALFSIVSRKVEREKHPKVFLPFWPQRESALPLCLRTKLFFSSFLFRHFLPLLSPSPFRLDSLIGSKQRKPVEEARATGAEHFQKIWLLVRRGVVDLSWLRLDYYLRSCQPRVGWGCLWRGEAPNWLARDDSTLAT